MARGGRGGGSRNPANQPREVQVSRKVSWLLRHGASSEGLKLGKGGYVGVADALNTRALKSLKITFEELKEVVAKNDKQRFSMIPASSLAEVPESAEEAPAQQADLTFGDDPADYLIRANQGHSIKVDTEGLLTPITREAGNVPAIVVHGTDERAWPLILKGGGLRRMTRNHIHFASGLPAGFKPLESSAVSEDAADAAPVISGMRMSSTVLIYVDINAALDKGVPFFVSENGVILTEGNEQGVLPYEFFSRVESRKKDGGVLMSDGKLPEGVVVDVEEWEKEMKNVGGKRGGRGVLTFTNALPHDALTPRATKSLRIMPLGDSITWGYINGGGSNGYRERLLSDLQSSGYTVDFVGTQKSGTMADKDNQGFPGYTISQIRGVVGGGLAFKPNVVLLHAGTNDLNRGNPSNEPDADAPRRLGLLLDDVLKSVPNAVVIVAKIIPSKQAGLNTNIKNFNNALAAIVSARVSKGSKVSLVDMNVLNQNSDLSDNLHPNAAGYAKMGDIWNAGIKAVADSIPAPA
ncbi:hypothetical protein E8E13_006982 [Curvularia kusanoi]|uniref:2'-phosphotransferase n=1 Tax=Curvularia kusanoi TaxID=90978 RepID=A0A9P4TMF2_CURKU|nr:hypothetical protein E8E13_006982 [Curvularia kusanoi]